MFSRLQAIIPLAQDGDLVDRWIKKIFPWKNAPSTEFARPEDRREFFRLNLETLPPLDATLILNNGTLVNMFVQDLSASGLCCRIADPVSMVEGQSLTVLFILPLETPVVMKTESLLVAMGVLRPSTAFLLRIKFSDHMNESNRELIHRFIIQKQFEIIQDRIR